MDFETPQFITDALRKRLDHSLFGYTVEPKDYWPTVQRWLHDHHQWDVKREWLTYIPGIVKGIGMVVNVFTRPDEKVIIQPPVYHPFRLTPQGNGREVVYNPLHENADGTYSMDFDNLARVADDKCRVLVLSNPHNPAGIVWDKETLARLADFCYDRHILVISDEIHCDLIRCGRRHIPMAKVMGDYPKLITCMAPSKTFNLAGLAFSNIIIRDKALRDRFKDRDKLFGMVNPMSLTAAKAAYEHGGAWHEALKEYLDGNFAFVKEFLARELPEAVMYIPEATYLAWVDLGKCLPETTDLPDFFANKAGVLLEGGNGLFVGNAAGYIRLNLAMPRSIIETGLTRMVEAIRKEQE